MTLRTLSILSYSILVFNVFFICSMAGNYIGITEASVDPEFSQYVHDYYGLLENTCPNHVYNTGTKYTIEFVNRHRKDSWIAYCIPRINGYYIAVDRKLYNTLIEPEKRQLLYHELSHCVVYKDHVNDITNYMNPVFSPILYDELLKQVTADMRSHCGGR